MPTESERKELHPLLIESMQLIAEARTDPQLSDRSAEVLNQALQRLGAAFALTRRENPGESVPNEAEATRLDRVFLKNEQFFSMAIGNPDLDLISLAEGPIPCVRACPGQLEYVVFAALLACRELAGGNQPMTVTLDRVSVTATDADADAGVTNQGGDYAAIAVQGRSRVHAQLPHPTLYDQVLATSQDAENTCCGLGMVHNIISSLGGSLVYDSSAHKNPALVIYLPLSDANESGLALANEDSQSPHDETVLLVDDDPMVRRYTRRALECSGFHVLEASDSAEAMATFRDQGGRIDILITDLVLPDMHGGKLANTIHEEFGQVPVIFVSGYDNRAIQHHGLIAQGASLLHKPYTRRSLLSMVENALGASA